MTSARTPGGKLRARGLGVPLPGRPGPHNAITDVPGVEVGYTTLIEGHGRLDVGKGPVRTGVTANLYPNFRSASQRSVPVLSTNTNISFVKTLNPVYILLGAFHSVEVQLSLASCV